MKCYGRPQVIVTDRLRSYQAAMCEIGNEARQVTDRWLNRSAALAEWRQMLPDAGRAAIFVESAVLV